MQRRRLLLAPLLGVLLTVPSPASMGGSGAGAPPAGAPVPRLEIGGTELDLGDIPRGRSATGRFVLHNSGDAVLELLGAEPGCGCTVVEYDKKIAPGQSGSLVATLDTTTLEGPVGKGIVLYTNDPRQPKLLLVVQARVVTSVTVLPDERMIVRNDASGGSARRLIRRDPTEGGFFEITGLKTSVPWLAASVRELRGIEPNTTELPRGRPGDWLLEVRIVGPRPYEQSRQEVEFHTGLERQPTVRVPVFVAIEPPVSLSENPLALRTHGTVASGMVIATVREGLDPAKLRVEAEPAGLSVDLESGGERFWKTHVRWPGGPLAGGRLVFRVGGESVELPVTLAADGS